MPIRLVPVFTSFLLFAVTGVAMYLAMDRTVYPFCDKRLVISVVSLLALGLLIAVIYMRRGEPSSVPRRCIRVASYVLVIAVSMGFWFDVWATQQCSESTRTRVQKLQH